MLGIHHQFNLAGRRGASGWGKGQTQGHNRNIGISEAMYAVFSTAGGGILGLRDRRRRKGSKMRVCPNHFAVRTTPFVAVVLPVIALLTLTGCLPAQIFWSPDGSRAAYLNHSMASLIDDHGRLVQRLGGSTGGFAWTADSKTLYVATAQPVAEVPVFEQDNRWLAAPSSTAPTTRPAQASARRESITVVSELRDGLLTPLFAVNQAYALHLQLSPSGDWLAVVTMDKDSSLMQLTAYSLKSRKAYPLSLSCGVGACFTSGNQLAYVEPDRLGDRPECLTGHVVEVKLDESSQKLERTPLLEVIPAETGWIVAQGRDLLLTAVPRTFPSKPPAEYEDEPVVNLYRFTRANGGVSAIAEGTGPLFMPSPDGKRILFEKVIPATADKPARRELALMSSNGSDSHILRDITAFGTSQPMWPNWRGNDEIAYIESAAASRAAPENHGDEFEVDLYKVTDKCELQTIRKLSSSWTDPLMKPALMPPQNKAP